MEIVGGGVMVRSGIAMIVGMVRAGFKGDGRSGRSCDD